jgi:hypothetical protein
MSTDLSWPATFPTPLLGTYAYTLGDTTQRTQFANGARVRELYTDASDVFDQAQVLLTKAETFVLQALFRRRWGSGRRWITMPVEAAGVRQDREVRITVMLQPQLVQTEPSRRRYLVAFAFETRQGTSPSEADLELIELWPDPNFAGPALQALELCVNTEDS